jgi:drug/metabolite transporter (DMT)-like permease
MTLSALILITLSAFAHAFWNFFSKRTSPSVGFFWIATLAATLILLPALWFFHAALPFVSIIDWVLVAVTGFFQAVYYVGLAGAYRNGDLSLAYPLVRALPVLLIALVSVLLGRGEQIGGWAFVGFAGVVLGCLLLPLPRFGDFHLAHFFNLCCAFAVLAAFSTVGYTLVDDQVLRHLRSAPGIPLENLPITLFFMLLENISLSIFAGLYVVFHPAERRQLVQKGRGLVLTASLTGLVMTGAYGLVLLAMADVSDVSYVSAFRQLSLPVGSFFGMAFAGEPRYLPRIVGLIVILAGLMLVVVG